MQIKLDELITLEQASEIIGISSQWLRELGKRGYVPTPVKGKVASDKIIQAYLKWLQNSSQTRENTAASKLQNLRAREIELRIDQKLSELVSIEDFSKSIEIIYKIIHSEMINLPSRATNDIALKQTIKTELDEIFKRTRKRIEEAYESYEYKPV
jgi:hypothetical protein